MLVQVSSVYAHLANKSIFYYMPCHHNASQNAVVKQQKFDKMVVVVGSRIDIH